LAAGDFFRAAQDLRDACVSLLGADAPARAAVRNGTPIFDDEDQLTVHSPAFGRWPAGIIASSRFEPVASEIAGSNQVTLTVTIIRCADGLDPSAQEAVAERCYRDVWLLWNGLRRRLSRKQVFSVPIEAGPDAMTTPVAVVNEQGNATGWTIGVVLTIDGYDPDEVP
jgi:hypothetical protein